MKLPRFILFLLVLSIFISGNGCSDDFDSDDSDCPNSVVKTADKPESYYTVLADENLTEEHKVAVLLALNEWAIKTAHTLSYKLSFVKMSRETPDTSSPHTIKIYVKDPGPGLLGWTSWAAGNYSAFILVRPSIDGELFRKIMLHELGHAFDLGFKGDVHYQGPYASMMHPSISSTAHLCCPELQAFCDKYGCQVDCNNTTSGVQTTSLDWKETKE